MHSTVKIICILAGGRVGEKVKVYTHLPPQAAQMQCSTSLDRKI